MNFHHPIRALALCVLLAAPTVLHAETSIRVGGTGTEQGSDTQAINVFKKNLEAQGQIAVKVFPNSQLGTIDEMLEQIRGGSLECIYESIGDLGSYSPAANIEGVAYLYNDEDHFFRVWRGVVGKELLDIVAQQSGIRLIGPAFRGFREFLVKRPVDKLADLGGMKIRAPGIPAYIESIRAMGASPTSLPYESVYSALQQGVVDGMEQTLIGIKDRRFYEVAKHLVMTNHIAETMGFMCSDAWYQKLDPKTKTYFEAAANASADWYRNYTDSDTKNLLTALTGEGVIVHQPSIDEFGRRAAAEAKYDPNLQPYVEKVRAVK
jgi:TRAP-type transport system periplasmic protein